MQRAPAAPRDGRLQDGLLTSLLWAGPQGLEAPLPVKEGRRVRSQELGCRGGLWGRPGRRGSCSCYCLFVHSFIHSLIQQVHTRHRPGPDAVVSEPGTCGVRSGVDPFVGTVNKGCSVAAQPRATGQGGSRTEETPHRSPRETADTPCPPQPPWPRPPSRPNPRPHGPRLPPTETGRTFFRATGSKRHRHSLQTWATPHKPLSESAHAEGHTSRDSTCTKRPGMASPQRRKIHAGLPGRGGGGGQ